MKVTNNNHVPKPFIPCNMYPLIAPLPCQVEAQELREEPPKPKQPRRAKEWRATMLKKREIRKQNKRITKAKSAKYKTQEALMLLEEQLAQ